MYLSQAITIFHNVITSDRSNVLSWFRSNEDGAELFSMIVPC